MYSEKSQLRYKNWKIYMAAFMVKKAAKEKFEFHSERVEFWKKKKEDTVEKMKTAGVVVHVDDTLSDMVSNALYSRQNSVEMSIPQELKNDYEECSNKLKEHSLKVRDYSLWVEMLSFMEDNDILGVAIDDYEFFFAK